MLAGVVHCGVPAVDAMLGGLPARHFNLITGASGTGKTAFAVGYLSAAMRRGDAACVVTSESPAALVDAFTEVTGFDAKAALRSGLLTVLSFGPNFAAKVRSIASALPVITELAEVCKTRKVTTVAIDTIDPLLTAADFGSAKRFTLELTSAIESLKVSCLATSLGSGSDALRIAISGLTARVATDLELIESRGERRLVVQRAEWLPHAIEVPIAFVKGEGIVARSAARRRDEPTEGIEQVVSSYLGSSASAAGEGAQRERQKEREKVVDLTTSRVRVPPN